MVVSGDACPSSVTNSPAPVDATGEAREAVHRLVELVDSAYLPALAELLKACFPQDGHQRLVLFSLCCSWWT